MKLSKNPIRFRVSKSVFLLGAFSELGMSNNEMFFGLDRGFWVCLSRWSKEVC